MALNHQNSPLFLLSLTLFFFLLFHFPLMHSLSTIAISKRFNQTLVCALIPSSIQQNSSSLNCRTFPANTTQIPIKLYNISYTGIGSGNGFICGLRSPPSSATSDVFCWRFAANVTKRIYKGPVLSDFESGDSHVCGIGNQLRCWQWRGLYRKNHNLSQIVSGIAVGGDFVCGLNASANIICLGNDGSVTRKVPSGSFNVVAAGKKQACAISTNGDLECWGETEGRKPEGKFTSLALGDNRGCTLRLNGTVVCWGKGNFRLPVGLEQSSFTRIVAKGSVFCGVFSFNFSLLCWGNEIFDGNSLVFQNVLPGACESLRQCRYGPLPGSAKFCAQGLSVCNPNCINNVSVPGMAPAASPKPQVTSSKRRNWSSKMVILLVVGCFGSVCLVASICFFLVLRYRHGRVSRVHDSGPIDEEPNPENDLEHQKKTPVLEKRLSHMYSTTSGGHLEEFPLEILLQVTNNFSQDSKIGIGGFGSVYHAILEDGREVAIKRAEVSLTSSNAVGIRRGQEYKDMAFMAELEFLSRLHHKNLVRLLGFYEDANECILVYEHMKNGSLHDHLHKAKDSSPLASWPARFKVALDAARGIQYLHEFAVPPVIHRDIKPSNILLNAEWIAKVSDFGLSLMGPKDGESHLSLWAAGTFGYVDPEYYRLHRLTTKSDIYSFGVVLLELLSGHKAIHMNEDGMPRNVVDFVVPYIARGDIHRVLDANVPPTTPVEIEAVTLVGYLAADCVSPEGRDRPSMSEVVGCLERALEVCLAPPDLSRSTTGSST